MKSANCIVCLPKLANTAKVASKLDAALNAIVAHAL